ncbi:MAG: UDP-N-acetylmuramoyl-L-alanine--D-glutamate ligase, partial [Elusimicrobiota bacterium]|nr:UDP-N-acetylmuramoyl-L-alanine--D-glutamate ligase [Elusimicrobiota bacterium]
MIKREYKNRKILIVGMARSGLSAGRFLAKRGARVYGYDIKSSQEINLKEDFPISLIDQKDPAEVNLDNYDLIVTSPGVKRDNPIIKRAGKINLPVISEMEAGLSVLPPVKIIAVTGTNGKTTTSKILEFLTGSFTAGNIGTPLTSVADQIKKGDLLILEVSSYQIPFSPFLTPEVAVLLNIFPEHLDWHGGYDNYVSDKISLFNRQSESQAALLNYSIKKEHPGLFKTIKSRKFFFSTRQKVKGAYIKDGGLYFSSNSDEELLMPVNNYKLKGEHNLENLAAAVCAAKLAGINKFPDIAGFRNLPHRMEEVIRREGVLYINDSKATNMDSLYQAVKSLEAPLI